MCWLFFEVAITLSRFDNCGIGASFRSPYNKAGLARLARLARMGWKGSDLISKFT